MPPAPDRLGQVGDRTARSSGVRASGGPSGARSRTGREPVAEARDVAAVEGGDVLHARHLPAVAAGQGSARRPCQRGRRGVRRRAGAGRRGRGRWRLGRPQARLGSGRRRAPDARRSPRVRLAAGLRPLSTDSVTFFRPHPGESRVVQNVSTAQPGEGASGQVTRLWIGGRKISTDCGQRRDPQAVHGVVHRRPTGWGRLSPVIPGFSTSLSTVRQHDAPDHRVE